MGQDQENSEMAPKIKAKAEIKVKRRKRTIPASSLILQRYNYLYTPLLQNSIFQVQS